VKLLKHHKSAIYLLVCTLVTVLFLSMPLQALGAEKEADEQKPQLEEFYKVYNDILENYVDEVDMEKLEEGAIKGMLEELDPYSQYFTSEEYQDFQEHTDGVFGGVGMKIEKVGDYVQVVAPLPDTPAEEAGLQPGDKILMVGTEDVKGYTLKRVADMIKGEPGTSVVLTIGRENVSEPMIISLTRETIKLDVVESEMLENNIGYIRLKTFSLYSVREFKKAIYQLKADGAEGFILDLRNNPGGYLGAALSVASTFVDEKDNLVYVVSRDKDENTYWSTSPAIDMPLVVLINKGSASGSEIVAGAVQDHGVGVLVGTQSFGKASVQTVKDLENGAAYKLTTAKYLTPNRNDINGIGLTPDYLVEDPEKQLEKAKEVLLGLIKNAGGQITLQLQIGDKTLTVNGISQELSDSPYLDGGRMMVPLRCVEELAQVSWDPESNSIIVENGEKRLEFKEGSSKVRVNGREISLPVPVKVKNGTSFVPLRFLAEQFGAAIEWNEEKQQVELILQ